MAKPSSLAREPSDRRERVRKARRFALKILRGSDAGVFVYHTPRRAARVAAACRTIGRHVRLEKEALAGVEVAAWLHELGFVQTPHKPVEGSLALARAFLEKYRYAPASAEIILNCIRAAHNEKLPQSPAEEVLCDASRVEWAGKNYPKGSQRLRLERALAADQRYSDAAWLQEQASQMESYGFRTPFASVYLESPRRANLRKLQKQMRTQGKEAATPVSPAPLVAAGKVDRAADTLFRVTLKDLVDLISITDRKAQVMINVNVIMISLILSVLVRKLDENPGLALPTFLLLAVCTSIAVLAVLSTRVVFHHLRQSEDAAKGRPQNLVAMAYFFKISLDDYKTGMHELVRSPDRLYDNLTENIYHLRSVLEKKSRYLKLAYDLFIFGLPLSVVAYLLAFLLT